MDSCGEELLFWLWRAGVRFGVLWGGLCCCYCGCWSVARFWRRQGSSSPSESESLDMTIASNLDWGGLSSGISSKPGGVDGRRGEEISMGADSREDAMFGCWEAML
jgi:hypothetical protein